MIAEAPLLAVSGASAQTPDGRRIFNGVELTVSQGESVGITGPSGVGKTALIGGIVNPQRGALFMTGRISWFSNWQAAGLHKVGYVPQGLHGLFIPEFAANRTIRVIINSLAPQSRDVLARIDELLRKFQLTSAIRRRRIDQLSGGEAQRLALAITLATNPTIWIADEPTASLDRANKQRLIEYLAAARAVRRTSMLIASHDREFLEAVCDRVLTLTPTGLTPASSPSPRETVSVSPKTKSELGLLVESVSQTYSTALERKRWVIKDFSYEFETGTVYGVVGHSGVGKSSLLRLLAGFERPRLGRVRCGPRRMGAALLVPQDARQFFNPFQTTGEFARDLGTSSSHPQSLDNLIGELASLGADRNLLRLAPHQPSGGEIQRLALATTLWLRPAIACLDEIDSGLDDQNKRLARARIREFAESTGATVILATHDLDFATSTCHVVLDADNHPAFSESDRDRAIGELK